jgi:tRNA (uracil-5-)-methyltransferase TRM9
LEKDIKDYETLAEDFSRTRHFTWDIEILSQYVSDGDRILDLGCGNGRLLKVLRGRKMEYFGLDTSKKLIEIARREHPQNRFEVGDILNLPYSDDFFNKVFVIRTLHHIPSKEFRLQALREARRVLKPGGLLVLTVWNVWGSKYKKNLLRVVKYGFLKIIGKTKLDFSDAFIPWWIMGEKVNRYFHFFTKKELKNLTEEVGLEVEKIWSSKFRGHSDIYLIAKPS